MKYALRAIALALFSFLWATSLFAQSTSISGTVSDPTGAVIPGAKITVENTATGLKRSDNTDQQGRYSFQQMTPGKYKLVAQATGFTDVIAENVELLVNSPATLNLKFDKLGSSATTIAVEAAATQINTTDASIGNAIGSEAIVEIPLFARNVAGLLSFQPGVTNFGSFGAALDYRSGSVNGGKSDQANVTLDGADVNDQNGRAAFTSVLRVTLDSVEEFRTTTTNGDAASGRGSGADTALITKSGTNTLHGSLYEYHRNTLTSANSFFNNRINLARPALLINVFGGSAGGAIKKNKAFFFLNYEGRRDASASSVTRTIPTDTLKQGIVQYRTTAGAIVKVGPDQIKTIDPGGIGVNAAAIKALNLFPAGNNNAVGDGLNTIGYTFNSPVHSDQNTYIAKFDYKIDDSGKHNVFIRGNLQNDSQNGTPQLPGLPANSVTLANNKGMAVGYTGVLTSNIVNTARYGFTRQGGDVTGVLASNYSWFRGYDTPYGTSTGTTRIVPVHSLNDDLSWEKGAHSIKVGGVARIISNGSLSYAHSYSFASSNPSWLKSSGGELSPASLGIAGGDKTSFQQGLAAVIGELSQGTANYNYTTDGTVLPVGAPVPRTFNNKEAEFYAQDSWKVTRNLTITAGLRLTLSPPVYEANGQQVSTNIPISDWLQGRQLLADSGQTQNNITPISFIAASKGRDMYPFHKNWAPRLAVAYSPKAEKGLSKWLFGGPGKTSLRAGAGMYYDLIGQPLAQTFNATAFGLATTLTNPPNQLSVAQVPRFVDFAQVPAALVRPPTPSTLGQNYPNAFSITNSIDDKLKAPYTMNLNFSIGRELPKGFFFQAAYVGRLSRRSLVNRDMAMPTNLKDPKSGQTYFEAFSQLSQLIDFQGVKLQNLPKIPFFENMWANAAGNGLTATQVWASDYINNSVQGDFTNTLANADIYCNGKTTAFVSPTVVDTPACGIYGPGMIFNQQFSALSAWSSVGSGTYHGMQITIRKKLSAGLLWDFNYTWSKSMDLGSQSESGGSFSGVIQNTWNTRQMRAVSNYDTTHQVNSYFVYQLPIGKGQKLGSNMPKLAEFLLGGWQISGTYRQTSGLPFNVGDGLRWATNWEITANATWNGVPVPNVVSTGNANGIAGPNLWQDPKVAFNSFQLTLPGQSGGRNQLRGDGLFNIDSGVYKVFTMPYKESHKFQIRWESFNLTNSVRFDPLSASANILSLGSFGKLSNTLTGPRQMQFAARYTF